MDRKNVRKIHKNNWHKKIYLVSGITVACVIIISAICIDFNRNHENNSLSNSSSSSSVASISTEESSKGDTSVISEVDSAVPAATSAVQNTGTDGAYSVSPFKGQSDDWRLMLANRNNVVEDYEPDTKTLPNEYCQDNSGYSVDSRIYDDTVSMIKAARNDGINLMVLSAYRPNSSQTRLFNNKVNYYLNQGYSQEDAEAVAATIVAIPGTSDHALGLGIDFNYLNQSDESKEELVWLKNHAEEYGFVMRYQKDKQNITGVSYEPWHYRYVGKENAKQMNSMNMCLEEYVEYLSK